MTSSTYASQFVLSPYFRGFLLSSPLYPKAVAEFPPLLPH